MLEGKKSALLSSSGNAGIRGDVGASVRGEWSSASLSSGGKWRSESGNVVVMLTSSRGDKEWGDDDCTPADVVDAAGKMLICSPRHWSTCATSSSSNEMPPNNDLELLTTYSSTPLHSMRFRTLLRYV